MNISAIHKLVESGFHEEALNKIQAAKNRGETNPILMLFEALALYDGKKDLECLVMLNKFLSEIGPEHEKYNYAIFTSGICLMNLGLPTEASKLFYLVPNEYPDIESERREAKIKSKVSKEAKNIFKSLIDRANA
jgi:outer membrane protein assembly factor BamD (BamD/ComL family)